tara:strand:- start:1322 stop:1465 length:144 start_codon:yes stop_codon:yes gene_type:complete
MCTHRCGQLVALAIVIAASAASFRAVKTLEHKEFSDGGRFAAFVHMD